MNEHASNRPPLLSPSSPRHAHVAPYATLVTRLIEACAAHPHSRECQAVTAMAPVLRAPLLVSIHVVLYGAAVQAWGRGAVDMIFTHATTIKAASTNSSVSVLRRSFKHR